MYESLPECKNFLDKTSYSKIGLLIGPDSYDYPYYKFLAGPDGTKRLIKHVFVRNASSIYLDDFVPDAVVSTNGNIENLILGDKVYHRTKIFKSGTIVLEPK
jgi:hypothetical protein